MKQEIIQTVAAAVGFTPLEIVLMICVGTMFFILLKSSKETATALTNNTNALNNLMTMLKTRKSKM